MAPPPVPNMSAPSIPVAFESVSPRYIMRITGAKFKGQAQLDEFKRSAKPTVKAVFQRMDTRFRLPATALNGGFELFDKYKGQAPLLTPRDYSQQMRESIVAMFNNKDNFIYYPTEAIFAGIDHLMLDHEATHQWIYNALGAKAYDQIPKWFDEGFSNFFSGQMPGDLQQLRGILIKSPEKIGDYIFRGELSMKREQWTGELRINFYYPYFTCIVEYMHQELGDRGISTLLKELKAGKDFPSSLNTAIALHGKDEGVVAFLQKATEYAQVKILSIRAN